MIGIRLWQVAGWTMLHYFWVGAALAAVALVARRRLRSSAAAVRYLVALGSLMLLSVAPAAIAVVVMQNVAPAPHGVPPIDPVLPIDSASQPEVPPLDELRPTLAAADAPLPVAVADQPVQPLETRYGERVLAVLDLAATWLPWLWVCGAPLSLLLTTVGLLGAERLRRQSRPLEDARIMELCRQLTEALRISCRVSVAICDRLAAPVLAGVLRPMILLPSAALAGWDPQQLEMVLMHELAHVRRYDNLVNLLQRIVESLLFFHPMVWIVSGWVRQEREHCCDALVVARTRQPRAYAEILVNLSERVSKNTLRSSSLVHPELVSSMAERSLVARVRRILKKEEQSMQVSRKAVALALVGLLALAMTIGGYCSLSSRAEDAPAGTAETRAQSDPKSNSAREADSRAWHVLSQADGDRLLLGLPERLGKTIVAPSRQGPMWNGVENGGRLALDVRIEGDAKGEIFIGFFADPRWWLAEPVQVRRVPGPGQYTFDRLIPGKYQLGAMLGAPSKPVALGVHATWPAPVEITKARHAAEARLLVSTKFRKFPAPQEGLTGQSAKMDAARMITVRTVDSAGKPVPFCRVTFVDRGDGTETVSFHEARTDDQGRAYCDKIKRAFSLCVQRFDFMPGRLANRCEDRKLAKIYHAQDRPDITITWDQFPTGTARVVGQVHDQNKQPLKEYFLTLTRQVGERRDWSDATSYEVSLPVMQPEARFEVADLPPGTYTVMVRAFDYSAYAWTFDGPKVTIPDAPHALVQFDVQVEAKELFYGRAVYQDGTPVSRGFWTAWFKRDIHSVWGGESFSWPLEKDGAFRVPLSREERRRLTVNSKGMVDVSASAPEARVQVPFSQLSKDPARPLKVVVPKPGAAGDSGNSPAASPERGAPKATDPSGKTSVEKPEGDIVRAPWTSVKFHVNDEKKRAEALTCTWQVTNKLTGKPIAGATVTVLQRAWRQFAPEKWPKVGETKHQTDAEGRYTFTVPPEQAAEELYIEITVEHPNYARFSGGYPIDMLRKLKRLAAQPFFPKIDLEPADKISGTIVTPDGKPAAGVWVRAFSMPDMRDFAHASFAVATTDKEGHFQINVINSGAAVFWILPKDYAPSTHLAHAKRGDFGRFVLEKGCVLKGFVVDVDGKPLSNVWVNAEIRGGAAKKTIPMSVADKLGRSALSDRKGEFVMAPLPAGVYRLAVADRPRESRPGEETPIHHPPAVFLNREITLGQDEPLKSIEIRAVPHVVVEGRFIDSSGKPTSGPGIPPDISAWTDATRPTSQFFVQTRMDEQGKFAAKAPKGLKAMLNLHGDEHHALRVRLSKDAPLSNGGNVELGALDRDITQIAVVRYAAPVLLVKAVAEDGKTIKEFEAKIKYLPGRAPYGEWIRNGKPIHPTNPSGDVTFKPQDDGRWRSNQLLPDEEFTLTVEAEGYEPRSEKLKLPEGAVKKLEVRLKETSESRLGPRQAKPPVPEDVDRGMLLDREPREMPGFNR